MENERQEPVDAGDEGQIDEEASGPRPGEPDWGRPETLESTSANKVMLWLLVPLIAVIVWQLIADR